MSSTEPRVVRNGEIVATLGTRFDPREVEGLSPADAQAVLESPVTTRSADVARALLAAALRGRFGERGGIVEGGGVHEPTRPIALAVGVQPFLALDAQGRVLCSATVQEVELRDPRPGQTYVLVARRRVRGRHRAGAMHVPLAEEERVQLLWHALPLEVTWEVELARVTWHPGCEPKLAMGGRGSGQLVDLAQRRHVHDEVLRRLAELSARLEVARATLADCDAVALGAERAAVDEAARALERRVAVLLVRCQRLSCRLELEPRHVHPGPQSHLHERNAP